MSQLAMAALWAHVISELFLGGRKLSGKYAIQQDGKQSKRSALIESRLTQYTRFHGLARVSLAILAFLTILQPSNSSVHALTACAMFQCGAAFFQLYAKLFEQAPKLSATFFLHLLIGAGLLYGAFNATTMAA